MASCSTWRTAMKACEVVKGGEYLAKVSGKLVAVRITSDALPRKNMRTGRYHGSFWRAVNLDTGRKIGIRSARRLKCDYRAWCEDQRRGLERRTWHLNYRIMAREQGLNAEQAVRYADEQCAHAVQEPPTAAQAVPEAPMPKPAPEPRYGLPMGLTRVSLNDDTGILSVEVPATVPAFVREDFEAWGMRRSPIDGAWWVKPPAEDRHGMLEWVTSTLAIHAESGRIPAVACAG